MTIPYQSVNKTRRIWAIIRRKQASLNKQLVFDNVLFNHKMF